MSIKLSRVLLLTAAVVSSSAWASRVLDGDNDTLRHDAQVFDTQTIDTTPVAVLIWFKRARSSHSSEETLLITGAAATTNHYMSIVINTDNTVSCRSRTSGNSQAISVATITDTTTWHMVLCVWSALNSRTIYLDGATGVTETTSRDPTNAPTLFSLGGDLSSTPALEFQGSMAFVTTWATTLPDATDAASLWNSGSGVDPSTVKGGSRIAAWDMTGNESPEVDDVGAFDLTLTGTTFSADDPFAIGGGASGLLLRRRRAANDDSFHQHPLRAVGF